jgi:hypothetical protein
MKHPDNPNKAKNNNAPAIKAQVLHQYRETLRAEMPTK